MKMKACKFRQVLLALTLSVSATLGCGVKVVTVLPTDKCVGTSFTGSVKDSLTNLPIAGANVVLETGFELGTTPIFNFSPSLTGKTDSQGAFGLCSSASLTIAAIVVEALDVAGNAYPPTITPLSTSSALGTILLGSCYVACGFPGQTQTSVPSGLSGVITTSPVSASGTLLARTAIPALDGSKNIWSMTIHGLSDGQLDTFESRPGVCPTSDEQCMSYMYTLPAQAPVELLAGVYKQQLAPPTYSISAATAPTNSCAQPILSTSFQADRSPLTAVPGKQLSATTLSFTGCH